MKYDFKVLKQDPMAYGNTMDQRLMGVGDTNPFVGHNSSPRLQMSASHMAACLVIAQPTQRNIQTGVEVEYGKTTYSIRMPADCVVVAVIDRYSSGAGGAVEINPEKFVIYEEAGTSRYGVVSVVGHAAQDGYFGYRYVFTDAVNRLRPGASFKRDEILADSPNVDKDGVYRQGIELKVAYMTHPAVAEDSALICADVLPKLAYRVYETYQISWGRNSVALNIYGDDTRYKCFPDIGDTIRDDSVLMAIRDQQEHAIADIQRSVNILAPVECDSESIKKIDYIFDRLTFAGGPKGRVVDVKVYHDQKGREYTPMDEQPLRYYNAKRSSSKQLVDLYHKLKTRHGPALVLTPEFHKLIVDCLADLRNDARGEDRVVLTYKQTQLDVWTAQFVVEYEIIPGIQNKVTDLYGGLTE